MGAGDFHSVDDQSRPLRKFATWGKDLAVWGLGDFKPSTNQSTSQTIKLQTNRLAILSAGQTFSQPTNSALANRSGIPASLMTTGRRIQRYILVARQSSTPTRPKDISPRSRPTESGSARAYPASASGRRTSLRSGGFHPFPIFGTGRQTGGKKRREELGDWQAVAL